MNALLLSALLFWAAPAADEVRYPAKPGPRDFILDEAKLLTQDDAAAVKALCEEVLTKRRAPIIVVTIPSLAKYGAAGWPIERYAMNLMSEWQVGWEDWNYGMLLLVSLGDRKVRIELGAGWPRAKDEEARRVLRERIVPKFKQQDFSRGILEGVQGLHAVALDQVPKRSSKTAPAYPADSTSPSASPIPTKPTAPGSGCLPAGGIGLIVMIVIGVVILNFIMKAFRGGVRSWGNNGPGYYGRGAYPSRGGGFGSGFGGGILGGALGSILADQYMRRSHASDQPSQAGYDSSSSSDSGGGSSGGGSDFDFGGGSFGGGFSGGGGATGEW